MRSDPRTIPTAPRPRPLLFGLVAAVIALTAACSGSSSTAHRAPCASTTSSTPHGAAAADSATRPPTPAEAALVVGRPYTLHEPPRAMDPAPLLVLLHGYGATGAGQAAYLKIAAATDAQGMLLAIPDGTTNVLQKQFWNATDACCAGRRTDVDDSAYLRGVVADVAAHHAVDPKRIYFVGHSNGGFMSYRMACDHADVIAAIVSLEAATYADPGKCQPTQSVAVLEIHGTGDELIKYPGGAITGHPYPGAKQTVATWARSDGCRPTPERPAPPAHTIETDLAPATVTAYSGCRGNGHVELWTQPGGVHIPPLDPTFSTQVVAYLLAHPKR